MSFVSRRGYLYICLLIGTWFALLTRIELKINVCCPVPSIPIGKHYTMLPQIFFGRVPVRNNDESCGIYCGQVNTLVICSK